MTTITARFPTTIDRPQTAAFSLVELMVALTLISMVLAALFSSWGFVGRSTLAMTQYTEMNSIGRMGLEVFAQDVRRARALEEGFTSTDFTLITEDRSGGTTTTNTIRYMYNVSNRTLSRQDGNRKTRQEIFKDVESVSFSFYGTDGEERHFNLGTRLIQLELLMSRDVQNREATKKIVSARYIMRNKDHGQ